MGRRKRRAVGPAPPVRTGRSAGWFLLALVLAAALPYANSLRNPFVFDDHGTVTNNPTIESLALPQVLEAPQETPVAGRPLVNLSFAVNYAIGGRDVVGYHVGNIAIHVLATLVLFGLVRRTLDFPRMRPLAGDRPTALAFAIALVWSVHPLNSEVLDYLTQRTESLMAVFYLLTLYAAARAAGARAGTRWSLFAVGAAFLGTLCKESMATVPVALVLYDRTFLYDSWKSALRARWRLWLGVASSWLLLGVLLAGHPRSYSAGFTAHDADTWTYLLNQTVMITRYLRLAVWPTDLVIFYGWPRPLTLAAVWPNALLVGALVAATVLALWRRPLAGFLGAWFFLTLAPTSSLVPIATEVGAERRMYLPLMALVALATVGGHRLLARLGSDSPHAGAPPLANRLGALAVALVALTGGVLTWQRNEEYVSTLRLAETTFDRWPTPGAHSMLGTELAAVHRFPEAEAHLRAAAPEFAPARYYLGTVLATEGKTDEAVTELESFIASQPNVLDQTRLARLFLADLFMKAARYRDAAAQYRAIIEARPQDPEAHGLLAGALVRLGAYDEAAAEYRRHLAITPDDVRALGGLGIALAATGHAADAVTPFRRAADLDPGNARAQMNLARALMNAGSLEEASQRAERAVGLAPDDASAHDLYGRILAATGRREAARDELLKAVALDPGSPAADALRQLGIR